jgi:peptidoglycan/xylan/chitin deacetylase (PgdA/CDA1 family)
MYHGLTEESEINDWTQLTVSDFAAQMDYLRNHYHPVPLPKMVDMLESGRVDPHSIAVTFDDGYKSNHDLAYPILKKFEIPATVFITSGFVLQKEIQTRFLWPDFISALLISYSGETLDLNDFGLSQYNLGSARSLYNVRNDISERLKAMDTAEAEHIIVTLNEKYGGIIQHERFTDYRPMTQNEVCRLAGSDLITIGAHSRNHPILSRIGSKRLEDEICGSKKDLESMIGAEVTEFAYPNGRWEDINNNAVAMTARHFDCAVTTEAGSNRPGHNKYLLRRIGIGRNLTLSQFRIMLSGVYYLAQKPVREY